MRAAEVLQVLDALQGVGVRYWIAGGWGVVALHGAATREHRDLDLAIDADTFGMARATLEALGFTAETDWLPVRLEMAGGPGGWVDLHPVRIDSEGDGVQQGLDGEVPTCFNCRNEDTVSNSLTRRFTKDLTK